MVVKFVLTKCSDCDGRGYVFPEDEMGRQLEMYQCPTCKHSPKPGYVLKRVEVEELDPVVIDSQKRKHYLYD